MRTPSGGELADLSGLDMTRKVIDREHAFYSFSGVNPPDDTAVFDIRYNHGFDRSARQDGPGGPFFEPEIVYLDDVYSSRPGLGSAAMALFLERVKGSGFSVARSDLNSSRMVGLFEKLVELDKIHERYYLPDYSATPQTKISTPELMQAEGLVSPEEALRLLVDAEARVDSAFGIQSVIKF